MLAVRAICVFLAFASTTSAVDCKASDIGSMTAGVHRLGRHCIINNEMLKKARECTTIDYFCVAGCTTCTDFIFNKLQLHTITGSDPMHGRSISVSGSKRLRSVAGLKGVKGELTGALVIDSMGVLKDLTGFEGITKIGLDRKKEHSVVVAYTESLKSVMGLKNAVFDMGTKKGSDGMLWMQANKALTCTPDHWPNRDQKSHKIPHGNCDHDEL